MQKKKQKKRTHAHKTNQTQSKPHQIQSGGVGEVEK